MRGYWDAVRNVGRWALVWVLLGALWLLYQGEWNAIMVWAAAAAGGLALVVALVVRRHSQPAARVERRWLARGAKIPWQVVREFAIVTVFLARALTRERVEGEFRTLDFPAGGARPAERGRRAFVELATGYSPNSYVLGIDQDEGNALVHVLERVPPGQELV